MLIYIAKRLMVALPTLLIVSMLVFGLQMLLPGDPVLAMAGEERDPETLARIREQLHLDDPVPVQYLRWLGGVVTGDLGTSLRTGEPVSQLIVQKLPVTIQLAVMSMIFAMLIGIPAGIIAAVRKGSVTDWLANFVALSGLSIPNFWLGIMLILLVSVNLGWLPSMGAGPGGSQDWQWDWAHMRHLVLPAVTLAVVPIGIVARTVRALAGDILSMDFVTALYAKGLSRGDVLRHVARNAAATALSVMGLQLGYLLGGSILIETVFNWPGSGFLLSNAIFQRDLPLLQGTILVLAMFFVGMNLIVDVAQAAIDPRVKRN